MKQKIIRKSKIGWVLADSRLIAFDKIQATIYHSYDTPNKKPLEEMKSRVENSKADELNSWVDVINLAREKGLRGYGTRLYKEWFES